MGDKREQVQPTTVHGGQTIRLVGAFVTIFVALRTRPSHDGMLIPDVFRHDHLLGPAPVVAVAMVS
jgi:hypothetical protein